MKTPAHKLILISLVLILSISSSWSGDYEDFIKSGDLYFRNGDYLQASKDYKKACEIKDDRAGGFYKTGKALNYLAMEWYGEKQHEYFEEAISYLTEAIKRDTKMWEAHLELARAVGTAGLFKPDWKQYTLAKRVKEELDIVFKNKDDCADAYYLLGMWHRWVSPRPLLWRKPIGLGEASMEGAVNSIRRAIHLDDKNLRYKLDLAKIYSLTGEKPKARSLVNTIIERKPDGELTVSQEYIFREASKLKDELSK